MKITIRGDKIVTRREITRALEIDQKIGESDIQYMYNLEKGREWYVILHKMALVDQCTRAESTTLSEHSFLSYEKLTNQRVRIRVHWLPPFYNNDILVEFFRQFGEVKSCQNVWDAETHILSATRELTIMVDEESREEIPHVVTFNDGKVKILITMPGRPPYCLKCKKVGHIRSQCFPTNTPTHRPTFAEVTRRAQSTTTAIATANINTTHETRAENQMDENRQTEPETEQDPKPDNNTTEEIDLTKVGDEGFKTVRGRKQKPRSANSSPKRQRTRSSSHSLSQDKGSKVQLGPLDLLKQAEKERNDNNTEMEVGTVSDRETAG